MSQPRSVSSFRKRLAGAGYFDIHINRDKSDLEYWIVSAREPLGGVTITIRAKGLDHLFRKKRHTIGYIFQQNLISNLDSKSLLTSE